MLIASSLISFHHSVPILESPSTFLTTIFISCFLISCIMYKADGKEKKCVRKTRSMEKPALQRLPILPPTIFGNASHLTLSPNETFTWLDSVKRKWGDVVRFRASGRSKVFINSYDVAMQLLSNETFLLKSKEFGLLRPVLGHSLAGLSPEFHSQRRELLECGFSGQVVENPLEIFCRYARKLRDNLMIYADNGMTFNAMDYTGLYAYRISCETALGHNIVQDIWNMDCNEQIAAWKAVVTHLDNRSSQPWLKSKSDYMFHRSLKGQEVQRCFQTINSFMEDNIFNRRQYWEFLKANQFYEDEDTTVKTKVKPECFADFLLDLEDKKELTKKEVLHNLNMYTAAGYDAVGTTLAKVLQFLASHPEIQEKCAEEIALILDDNDKDKTKEPLKPRLGSSSFSNASTPPQPPSQKSPSFDTFTTIFSLIFATSDLHITSEHLQQMKYLECCIKEALRLSPMLPWLLRKTHKDIQLDDKSVISAGVDVLISTCIINRDPKNFPEPDMFKPERHFSKDVTAAENSSSFMSFGAGPKFCPGMAFAVQQLKVLLAHLLLAFKWESAGEEEEKKEKIIEEKNVNPNNGVDDEDEKNKCLFHGLLIPDNGLNVKISRRT